MLREAKDKITLDYSLRNVYISLRNRRCYLVAIEFEHRGKKWRADTVNEAVALRRQLEMVDKNDKKPDDNHVWTPDLVMELMSNAGELQQQLMQEIHKHPMISSADLVKRLGLESHIALAGVLSGLSKLLKRLAMLPSDVYRVEVKWSGRSKERYFVLAYDFQVAAVELGWPEAWEKGKKKTDAPATK